MKNSSNRSDQNRNPPKGEEEHIILPTSATSSIATTSATDTNTVEGTGTSLGVLQQAKQLVLYPKGKPLLLEGKQGGSALPSAGVVASASPAVALTAPAGAVGAPIKDDDDGTGGSLSVPASAAAAAVVDSPAAAALTAPANAVGDLSDDDDGTEVNNDRGKRKLAKLEASTGRRRSSAGATRSTTDSTTRTAAIPVAGGASSNDRGKKKIAKLEAITGRRNTRRRSSPPAPSTGDATGLRNSGHKNHRPLLEDDDDDGEEEEEEEHQLVLASSFLDDVDSDALSTQQTTAIVAALPTIIDEEVTFSGVSNLPAPTAAAAPVPVPTDLNDNDSSPITTTTTAAAAAALQRGNTEPLAVATAIDEELPVAVTNAQEVDPEELERKNIEKKKNRQCIIVGLVVIALCLAVLLGSIFGRTTRGSNNNKAVDPPPITLVPSSSPPPTTKSPSSTPSAAPSTALELLRYNLPNQTLVSLEAFGTPQYKAWAWLSNHPNVTDFKEWKKQQLLALATFYYSFEGENWNPPIRERWMDYNKDECLWFSSGYGYFSSWTGEYEEYELKYQTPSCINDDDVTNQSRSNTGEKGRFISRCHTMLPSTYPVGCHLFVILRSRDRLRNFLLLPSMWAAAVALHQSGIEAPPRFAALLEHSELYEDATTNS